MQVIRDFDGKGVTIIGDHGNMVVQRATTFLGVWTRKDGGVTLHADGRPKNETVRVDNQGRLINKPVRAKSPVRVGRPINPRTGQAVPKGAVPPITPRTRRRAKV